MRKWIIFLLCTVCFIPIAASAHSGGTDAKGGHRNHSTGVYHYHHGYSAHDHYDMDGDGKDDCPYTYNEKNSNQEIKPKKTLWEVFMKLVGSLLPSLFLAFMVTHMLIIVLPLFVNDMQLESIACIYIVIFIIVWLIMTFS